MLLVVGVGTLLGALAGSAGNLALPALAADLGLTLDRAGWTVTAFLITSTIFMLVAGRVGDRIGHRTIYVAGFGVMIVTSLVCGATHSFPVLLAARALQGIGGAMVMAAGPALLTTSFPGSQRGRALGMLGTATYTGLTFGPMVGGVVVSALDWRWLFFLYAPFAAAVGLVGVLCLPGRGPAPSAARGSMFGFDLFRSRVFTGAVVSAVGNYVAQFVVVILMPFYLIEALGIAPARAGMLVSSQALVMALVTSPSGRLSDRIGSRGLATGGLLILAASMAGMSFLGPTSTQIHVALWMALAGLGAGVFVSPNSAALMGAAPRDRQGTASAVMAVARTVGMIVGVALATTVYRVAGGETGAAWGPDDFTALRVSLWVAAGVSLLSAIAAALRGGERSA